MSAARKSSSTEREADAPKPGQRTSGWRQSRSLDSHYVTNHTLTVCEGVITQSRAKSPGAPQTPTLSLCLIEQFNVMLGTVPRHSIRYPLLSSTLSLSSARRFPTRLTHRAEGTPNSHILFWMKWPSDFLFPSPMCPVLRTSNFVDKCASISNSRRAATSQKSSPWHKPCSSGPASNAELALPIWIPSSPTWSVHVARHTAAASSVPFMVLRSNAQYPSPA